jgi:hypothetical protein
MLKKKVEEDSSTEDKIKKAAQKVFTQKGYSATRTRDIAEEAGINLALLNYYFRSKEKLFDIIMMENMQQFLFALKGVFNNKKLSLNEKTISVVENYILLLKSNPDLPLFILHEIKSNPQKLAANMGMRKLLFESDFYKQLRKKSGTKINPLHFIINIIGLTVFPFIASPLLKIIGEINQAEFDKMMDERKKMIPLWMEAILKIKY